MRLLWRKLWRDVDHQRAQFAVVALTTLLGVALFGASYASYQNLKASYAGLYRRLRFADLTVEGGAVADFAVRAEAVSGVAAVQTRTVADVPLAVGNGVPLFGRVVGLPPQHQPDVDRVTVVTGQYLDPARPDGVLVEQHLANHDGLRPGDRLRLHGPDGWHDVTVLGVVASAEYLWPARSRQEILTTADTFGVVFVPEALAAQLSGLAAPNQAVVFLAPGTDRDAALGQLRGLATAAGATAAFTREEQPSNAALSEDVDGFGELAVLFPLLFLGAAAMTVYVLLSRLVHAQRAQIGTLVANGVRPRPILLHYLGFGLVPCVLGGVLGALAGAGLARVVSGAYTSALSIPLTVIGGHPATVASGVVVAVLVGALAALSPAVAASRLPPAAAMRGPAPTGSGRSTLAERVLPPLQHLPSRYALVLRDVGRNPRRSLTTGAGVVLALVLIIVAWGMLDTTHFLLNRQFDQIQRQDAEVYAAGTVDAAVTGRVAATAGVARAEPVLDLPATLAAGDRQYPTRLLAFEPGTAMHTFFGTDGKPEPLPAQGLLVGVALRDSLGIAVGDDVALVLPGTTGPIAARVAGFVDEPLGTYAYGSLADFRQATGEVGTNAVMVRFQPGADRQAVRSRLAAVPGVVAVADTQALADAVDALMALFDVFVGIMLVFGAALAFALIFSTISVTVAERTVELATLRTAGVGQRTIAWLVTAENLLVVGLALVPGLVVARWSAAVFMAAFTSDLFRFDLHVRATTYLMAALAILAVALLSQWPAVRAVGRLDLAATVRERSL
ncbi:MAG TPA: FtsX-like permease family protein [Thermomicrobiales bacterium]